MLFSRKTAGKPKADAKASGARTPSLRQALALSKSGSGAASQSHFDDLPTLLRISKAIFDPANKILEVNGWCLTPEPKFDLFLEVLGTSLVSAIPANSEHRQDVFEAHFEYGNKTGGWRVRLPAESLPEECSVRAVYVSDARTEAFDRPVSNLAVPETAQLAESLTLKKCSYSPLRSLCVLDAELVSNRDEWSFELTLPGEIKIRNLRHHAVPTSKPGRWNVKLSFQAAGLRDKEEVTLRETGNPLLTAQVSVSTLKDSPRRVAATTPSVKQDISVKADGLTLEDLNALRQDLVERPKPTKVDGEVCYFPAFPDAVALANHFHRASWYLTGENSPISKVSLACSESIDQISAAPDCFGSSSFNAERLEILEVSEDYLDALQRAQTIMVWRPLSDGLKRYLSKLLRKVDIITVATDDPASVEYGNYCRAPWMMLPEADKQTWLTESQQRFRQVLQSERDSGKTCSAVFGTGPSIDQAFDFDFGECMTVACNSVVANEDLLDHISPTFICAGDAVSHFGVSKYAETFRADLVSVLQDRNIYFLTTAAIGFLLVQKHPEIRDRVLLCEQRFTGLNCELESVWSLPRFDSTLNIHMLPIASSFSDTVYLLGLDGRDPNPDNNEDFWAHSKSAQYHELVESGHLAHPTFALNRAQATEDRYLASVQESFMSGEALGKSYFALADSFTPAVHGRPAPGHCFSSTLEGRKRVRGVVTTNSGKTERGKRALVVMQMNRRHFSGGRYHGTMLAEAMAKFCDEVVVWTNNMPPWSGDLSACPNHAKVCYHVDEFLRPPDGDFDYIVVLPDGGRKSGVYYQIFEKARDCGAKTVFINFESPNWFNALSPSPKRLADADHWFAAACFTDVVLSSAETAVPFAEHYYQTLYHTPSFAVAPPAINSPIADLVKAQAGDQTREKQIILISRFGNTSAHKNINAIFDCITPEMQGYTLALIAGTSDLPDEETLEAFRARLSERGMSLKLLYMISDRQKYEEIAKSELMIFPSLFEGFGYPPVEAGYMGTPCIAYDLPVLKEFNADHTHFVPWGDKEALRNKISEVLQLPPKERRLTLTPAVLETATLDAFAANLEAVLTQSPSPQAAAGFTREAFDLARQVYLDGCHETELTYGTMNSQTLQELAKRYIRYSRIAAEALEKLQARGVSTEVEKAGEQK